MAWAKLGFSKDGSSGWWKSRAKPLKLCSSLCSAPLKSQPFVWGFAASTRTTDRGFYTTAPGLSITSTHPPGYSSQLMLCRKHTLNIKHLLVAKRLLQVDLWAKDLTAGRRAALKGGKECIPKKLGEYRLGILRKSWKICWLSTAWALFFFVPLAFLEWYEDTQHRSCPTALHLPSPDAACAINEKATRIPAEHKKQAC